MSGQRMSLCGKSMKGSRQIFRCVDQVCIGAEQVQRQGKIDIIVAQPEQKLLRLCNDLHVYINLRIVLQVAGNAAAQSFAGKLAGYAQTERTGDGRCVLLSDLQGIFGHADNGCRIGQKFLPGLGDADLFAYALVKLCSKLLLQLLHLHSNGGLGISQQLCGFGKTLGLSYFGKCDQVSNFHEVLSLYRN